MTRNLHKRLPDLKAVLQDMEGLLVGLSEQLGGCGRERLARWRAVVNSRLLARFAPDAPLVAVICGGGSAGKSTLFNTLAGEAVSPAGGRAGMNRRVLIAASRERFSAPEALAELFAPFDWHPRQLREPAELTRTGDPLYVLSDSLPPHLLLLDTPDFDTGAKGVYTNREAARQALELADLMLYIFTNSNYANRDNTDFVAKMLTGVGQRRAYFVYRAYPSFGDDEVRRHAMTVACNIYGERAEEFLMGIYRADEDNEVAAGRRPMALRPLENGAPPLDEALTGMDPIPIRLSLFSSVIADVVTIAERITAEAGVCLDELMLYTEAVEAVEAECLKTALRHFPLDTVMRRFARIWSRGDPTHIRAMRKTGSILAYPVRLVSRLIRGNEANEPGPGEGELSDDARRQIQADLLEAANRLYEQILAPRIEVPLADAVPHAAKTAEAVARVRSAREIRGDDTPRISAPEGGGQRMLATDAPPALDEPRRRVRQRSWASLAEALEERSRGVVDFSGHIDAELAQLADRLRAQMSWRDRVTQTFAAFLNVLPATAAVTYILSTGDPVGAAGIKIKLGSLFGLHDLYALVALPATSGLNKADRAQLERLLAPVARVWLDDRAGLVRHMLEEEISAPLLSRAREDMDISRRLITQLEEKLSLCRSALKPN